MVWSPPNDVVAALVCEEAEGMMGEGVGVDKRRFIKQVWWGKVGLIPAALGSEAYLGHRALWHKQLALVLAGGSQPSD